MLFFDSKMFDNIIIFIFIHICVSTVVIFIISMLSKFERKVRKKVAHLPGPNGFFLIGNLGMILDQYFSEKEGFTQRLVNLTRVYKVHNHKGLFKLDCGLFGNLVVLYSSARIKPLLKQQNMIDKPTIFKMFVPWLGNTIYTLDGDKWKTRRRVLQPTFNYRKLELAIQPFNTNIKQMIEFLNQRVESNNPIVSDLRTFTSKYILDILCESMLGFKMHRQPKIGLAYIELFEKITELLILRAHSLFGYFDITYKMTRNSRMFALLKKASDQFAAMQLNERKAYFAAKMSENTDESDEEIRNNEIYLDHLIRQQIKFPDQWTDNEIICEIQTLMFGGLDTSINAIPYALLLIGLDEKIQDRIHEELNDIYLDDREKDFNIEDSHQMVYLENCIKETLRIFPPVPVFIRNTREDIDLDGVKIMANTDCYINVYELHRDPEMYPNPELFDPDRFLKENMAKRSVYDFIPFSAGPRICLGQKFGMVQMKAILSWVFRNFRVKSLTKRNYMKLDYNIVLKSMDNICIKFERL